MRGVFNVLYCCVLHTVCLYRSQQTLNEHTASHEVHATPPLGFHPVILKFLKLKISSFNLLRPSDAVYNDALCSLPALELVQPTCFLVITVYTKTLTPAWSKDQVGLPSA